MTDVLVEDPARPHTWREGIGQLRSEALVVLVPTALLGNLALQTEASGLVAPVAVIAAVCFLWLADAFSRPTTRAVVCAAVLLAVWLPLRDSSWLTTLNSLTCAALVAGAVAFDKRPTPRLSVRSFGDMIARATAGFAGPALVARSLLAAVPHGRVRSNEALVAVLRGLTIAAVPVLVLAAFLAQADAIFAAAFGLDLQADALLSHGLIAGFVALALTGLVCVGRVGSKEDAGRPGLLGGVEVTTVLACLFALFGAFAVSQVVGVFADVDAILEARGTTYADYARSGFFQLLAVAALTLALLGALQAMSKPTEGAIDRVRRALGGAVCLLTVLIVAVSIGRLGLYVEAFGQTTLRWYSTAFAWMLGVIFVMFAGQHIGTTQRPWFGRASLVVVVATMLCVNVLNPEHRVAEHNLTHDATESTVDAWYLVRLSADAWPVLLDHVDQLTTDDYEGSRSTKVPRSYFDERCLITAEQTGFGIAGVNVARHRLACPTAGG